MLTPELPTRSAQALSHLHRSGNRTSEHVIPSDHESRVAHLELDPVIPTEEYDQVGPAIIRYKIEVAHPGMSTSRNRGHIQDAEQRAQTPVAPLPLRQCVSLSLHTWL